MPKIDIYDWEGVDLVSDPYQRRKGSFEQAQNIEYNKVGGKGAFRKRAGLSAINSSALSTPIRGIVLVPLPGLTQRYIYSGSLLRTDLDDYAPVASTGLLIGADVVPTATGPEVVVGSINVGLVVPSARIGGQVFYAREGNVNHQFVSLVAFEGTNPSTLIEYELAQFPSSINYNSPDIAPILRWRDQVVIGVPGASSNPVFIIEPRTGAMSLLGTAFAASEPPRSGADFLGRLFIGTARKGSTGRIHYLRTNDSAWTLERTAAANHPTYSGMAVYDGALYAGTGAKAGTAAIIEKRTAGGTWSTSFTGPDTTHDNCFHGLTVYDGDLYAIYENDNDSVNAVYKFDGSSWSLDLDLDSNSTGWIRGITVHSGDLYIAAAKTSGHGIWRKRSGSWSNVTGSFSTPAGPLFVA